ncbi:hypothetical protein B0H13DRAFT_1852279 [Mycena leptocephala]|nr:hypothetical protein B0H13DRAFT_1852279 [Mycena leptocephala]
MNSAQNMHLEIVINDIPWAFVTDICTVGERHAGKSGDVIWKIEVPEIVCWARVIVVNQLLTSLKQQCDEEQRETMPTIFSGGSCRRPNLAEAPPNFECFGSYHNQTFEKSAHSLGPLSFLLSLFGRIAPNVEL